jgi:hypothetical protein
LSEGLIHHKVITLLGDGSSLLEQLCLMVTLADVVAVQFSICESMDLAGDYTSLSMW